MQQMLSLAQVIPTLPASLPEYHSSGSMQRLAAAYPTVRHRWKAWPQLLLLLLAVLGPSGEHLLLISISGP